MSDLIDEYRQAAHLMRSIARAILLGGLLFMSLMLIFEAAWFFMLRDGIPEWVGWADLAVLGAMIFLYLVTYVSAMHYEAQSLLLELMRFKAREEGIELIEAGDL